MKTRVFTGDGGGSIEFIPGHPESPLVTPAPYEKPWPNFSKSIPKRFWAGTADNWGLYSREMAVRDEGFRGLPVDHRHPRLEAAGIRDHKEGVAAQLLAALHEGDYTYFDGLADTLRKFEKLEGNPTPEARLQDVTAAIRAAAIECDGVPTQKAVFDCWVPGRGPNYSIEDAKGRDAVLWKKFKTDKLVPLGFQWLPAGTKGRPRKSP